MANLKKYLELSWFLLVCVEGWRESSNLDPRYATGVHFVAFSRNIPVTEFRS